MIWFKCKSCGQAHGRGENLAGTMVFCTCGHGNIVPWTSTAPEPEATEAIPIPTSVPVPKPIPDDPDRERRRHVPPSIPVDDEDDPTPSTLPKKRSYRRVNPAYCLNHEEADSEQTCDECKLAFCSACVVTLEGRTLCAACKNFRIRGMTRPLRISAMSVVALVMGLVSGPVTFCLTMVPVNALVEGEGSAGLTILLSIIGLLLPFGCLVLAHLALREIDTQPHVGGRALAMTAGVSGIVGLLWCLTVTLLVMMKQWSA